MFFVVGRLWEDNRLGIDHLAFVVTAVAANVYSSYINTFRFLRISVTLYEIHCVWPLASFFFIGGILVPVVSYVIGKHILYAVENGILVQKLLEILLTCFYLLAPVMTSPYFHFHHYFAGLLGGMHCNFPTYWSSAAMAWLWGLYINGIAVYGRDPTLTCDYSYYLSDSGSCPYLECYLYNLAFPPTQAPTVLGETAAPNDVPPFHPMITPDWRNCSAVSFEP
jgi:hypothetical protein